MALFFNETRLTFKLAVLVYQRCVDAKLEKMNRSI